MKTLIFYCGLAVLLIIYSGYTNYKDKQSLTNELTTLKKVIEQTEKALQRYQQISEKAETEKREAENQSIKLTAQLNNALKNTKCSEELVPAAIAGKLYNRANQIRQCTKNIYHAME